jgi:hypothetical protein
MNRNRQHLAWIILLLSFATCLGLAVGIPLGAQHYVRTARVRLTAVLEPQRGTPGMQRDGRGAVEAVVAAIGSVPAGTVVTTDEAAQGLLTLYAAGDEPAAVSTVQIYNDTAVNFTRGRSPRFGASHLPHQVDLEVASGRVRITVDPAHERPTVLQLRTPHLNATLMEGSYEVRVYPGSSELAVRAGSAEVLIEQGASVLLGPSQRTIARSGSSTLNVLPGERNLLLNGSFDQRLQDWQIYYRDVQQEPGGAVEVSSEGGRTSARFVRPQENLGHTEVGIRQQVNYDVRDFATLSLHLNLQVLYQSLPGCGSLGSECPILVRISYEDVDGTDRTWYHGFYAVEAAPGDFLAEWDEQVPATTWYPFDSGNLVELFERPPALIKEVAIYASGHAFDALVTEVELLAQE